MRRLHGRSPVVTRVRLADGGLRADDTGLPVADECRVPADAPDEAVARAENHATEAVQHTGGNAVTKAQIHHELLSRLKKGQWVTRTSVVRLIEEAFRPGANPYQFPWKPRTKATKRKARR